MIFPPRKEYNRLAAFRHVGLRRRRTAAAKRMLHYFAEHQ
jgi:hypothetical protein